MNALGMALVWCILQVTLLASLAAILYGLARRGGAPARALAAFAGLMMIVGLTALAFSPWASWHIRPGPSSAKLERLNSHKTDVPSIEMVANETGSDAGMSEDQPRPASAGSTKMSDSLGMFTALSETFLSELRRVPTAAVAESWRWPASVAVLFLIGCGLGLARLVAGLVAVRSYRHDARPITDAALQEMADVLLAELRAPRAVVLCESERLATPATIGWRRPLIILPADWRSWTSDECRAVLAHEIAHIARHDFATWVAAQGAVVFHFYHPLVHWLAGRLRLEQELAADAEAARFTGGQQSYLMTLAGMALRQSDRPLPWPARTFLPTRGTFMRRIEMLRNKKPLSANLSAGTRIGMIAVLMLAGLAVAGLRGTETTGVDNRRNADAALSGVAEGDPTPDNNTFSTVQRDFTPGLPRTTYNVRLQSQLTARDADEGKGGIGTAQLEHAPFSLSYVPRDAVAVAAFRPAELLERPVLAPLKKALSEHPVVQETWGVSADRIEQVTLIVLSEQVELAPKPPIVGAVLAGAVVRLVDARNAEAVFKKLLPDAAFEKLEPSQNYVHSKEGKGPFCFLADERTIVICEREDHARRLIVAGKNGATNAKWTSDWRAASNPDMAVLINAAPAQDLTDQFVPRQSAFYAPRSALARDIERLAHA